MSEKSEKIFFEAFSNLPRLAPGGPEWTIKAFRMINGAAKDIKILALGCGEGDEVITLAKICPQAKITAVDLNADYLETLQKKAKENLLEENICVIAGDMAAPDVPEGSFDLIWSEGSAYSIGFENAINTWNKFLCRGGWLAVSELVWTSSSAAAESVEFWHVNYPDMQSISARIDGFKAAQYGTVRYFVMPGRAWWENFYTPLEHRLDELKSKYKDTEQEQEARGVIGAISQEITIKRRYGSDYGYAFFIAQAR